MRVSRLHAYIGYLAIGLSLSACSYNPMVRDNHTTGSPLGAAIGAGVGAGSVGLLGGSKFYIGLAAVGGGAIGYYVTTLRYDAGGVIEGGGDVYKVGEFVGISIPTDKLFEPNSAEFTENAPYILDSAVDVLNRYPTHNILISGSTSGFGRPRYETELSLKRARAVSSYLWKSGINDFKTQSNDMRKLDYVGYGNYFPVGNADSNSSIRANSRIQITSYPIGADLGLGKRNMAVHNVGGLDDEPTPSKPKKCGFKDGDCTPDDT
jgi:outer membrane protein OmpA-like peptidoglycan-associated protein